MRTIKYLPKITQAPTEYREISEDDHQWLIETLSRWLARLAELDAAHTEDQRCVREQWWHRRTKTLPRSRQGLNTPCSFVGGCLWNMLWAEPRQRDFTAHQMEGIEIISAVLGIAYAEEEPIRFQIGFTEH